MPTIPRGPSYPTIPSHFPMHLLLLRARYYDSLLPRRLEWEKVPSVMSFYDRNVREAAVPMDVNRLDLLDEFKSCNVRELEGCNPVAPPPPPWATLGAKTLAEDMEATL
eukprot:scaffold49667_cov37-Cyclotella_meneghiniana.AAC.1